jgi:hypothetical protein
MEKQPRVLADAKAREIHVQHYVVRGETIQWMARAAEGDVRCRRNRLCLQVLTEAAKVDGSRVADLASVFGLQPSSPQITLAICIREVEQAGLLVDFAQESMGKMKFTDVGALVYYAHAAPWDVPEDFSVERYTPLLLELHHQHRLSFDMGHFIIQAHKPAS